MFAPRSYHYAIVLHIFRYTKGTIFHGLYFFAHSSLELRVFFYAYWVGDRTDRYSTTNICISLGDSLIS